MKARQLIADRALDPAQLGILFRAFDLAWSKLAPDIGSNVQTIEAARLKLANLVLAIASAGGVEDPDLMADTALKVYRVQAAPRPMKR